MLYHRGMANEEILIVDDELSNLQLLNDVLSRAGKSVRPSRDPQLAIESAKARQPDLILLDVKMPGMDGFELCKQWLPRCEVLIVQPRSLVGTNVGAQKNP